MKKIMLSVLTVALMVGCRSVENGAVVPFNVHSRGEIPAKKIKLINDDDKTMFEGRTVSFSPLKPTIFQKSDLFFVATRGMSPSFSIAVPKGSDIALMMTGNIKLVNEIIKKEGFDVNKMESSQIKELVIDCFNLITCEGEFIVKSIKDMDYNTNLSKDVKRKAEAEKLLGKVIKPMRVVKKDHKAIVEFYFVKDQDIVKRTVTLNQDGTIDPKSIKDEVVGKDLAPWHRGF